MFPFSRSIALAALFGLACAMPAHGQVEIQPDELDVQQQHFAVSLNGVDVSADSVLYLANDGTLFASAPDLAGWRLRYKEEPAFIRNGKPYYGLQTQLKLAVAVQRPQERLQIIAPPTAFLGGPERQDLPLTPGGGTFLNYKLDYRGATSFDGASTSGEYNLFLTHNSSALRVDYGSLQSASGIAFARRSSTLSATDYRNHRVISLGEQEMDAGDLGSNDEILGVHVASDYAVDPHFITQALPSIESFALQPSLVEVFVNNKLQWRQQVLEGPFTVRNLPPSAAHGDVTLVFTDAGGHRTTKTVRPNYEAGLAATGMTQYVFDAGYLEKEPSTFDLGEPHAGSNFAASAQVRHGLTSWLTLQAMGESIGGDPFAAVGAELRPFAGDATVWFGNGKLRRSTRLSYTFSADKFSLSERLDYNAVRRPDPFDPNLVSSNFREEGDLQYSPNYDLRFELKLDRDVSSEGFSQSLLTLLSTIGMGSVDLSFEPMYDRSRHAIDVRLQLSQRAGSTHRFSETANQRVSSPISTSLGYSRSPRDPDDRWRFGTTFAMGRTLTRTAFAENQMPWADAKAQAQHTTGFGGDVTGELEGAAGLIYGGGLHAMRDRYQENAVGVVRIAGFSGVRISVNDSPAGHTDGSGNLVLPQLSALQENIIVADLSGIPLGVDLKDPYVAVPLPATPVSINMLAPEAQSVAVRVVDANGHALPQATWLSADNGARFPIGFDGRAFIHGMTPGAHRFSTESGARCSFRLTLEPRWEIVEAGAQTCR
ncbi:MAG TPA: fimbria/pilus outer membrane usher protein [Candidatus Rubrimentiphilum sp.]|nr:fimbria/pilus outer membrane usher protein [Candidatus Rubrimentiphilum sp.]